MRYRLLIGAMCAAVTAGCASSTRGTRAETPSGMRDVITAEELSRVGTPNAYLAVQQLRPSFLRSRGPTSLSGGPAEPIVYLNNQRMGGAHELENISIADIREIRYLSPSEATNKFGTGHTAGAIMVFTKH